jgi:GNAT superfamily N-acetyltransferase
VLLRPGTREDAPAVAEVHLASRRAAAMPPSVHEDHELLPFLADRMATDEVWVAEVDGEVVGYLRMTPTWLDDLYVAPGHAGQGIGSALLDLAKARRPDGFSLWVFEMNAPARAFYRRHGLVEREHTDGRDNEERAPDLRMSWSG